MISSCSTAAAKLILFGEHAVVYGQPAIAIPLPNVRASAVVSIDISATSPVIEAKDLNITTSLNKKDKHTSTLHIFKAIDLFEKKIKTLPSSGWCLTVWSKIPFSRGLGSSAAISIAILRALAASQKIQFSANELIDLSYELEKFHHRTPSGIDNTVVALESPIIFQKDQNPENIIPKKFFFIVGDTGIGKKTSDVVNFVASNYKKRSSQYDGIFQEIGLISTKGKGILVNGSAKKLGELMNENQLLLNKLGVSSAELDNLIKTAKNAGALGAKLCGAGKGGCMVALAKNADSAEVIANDLRKAGAVKSFITRLK